MPSTLTVLSYNIREGGQGRLDRIAALIREQRPDAVALVEASDRAAVEWLAGDLGCDLAIGEANSRHSIAWLSRRPIMRAENHRSPLLAKTLLEIELPFGDETICLFATHLGSRHDRPQPANEIPVILDLLSRRADRAHLLVGDFNALAPDEPVGMPPPGVAKRGDAVDGAPRPAIRQLLASGYVDGYRALHPESPGYTYPADAPWLRLDYVFLCPRLASRLVECDVVAGPEAALASDHLPIWARLR
jgi:endonuclease/exonuclease/phosphatase family metal-dependent hydrolase